MTDKQIKNISVLGSTGSIGCNVLKVVEKFPERYSIKALAAGTNTDLLARQIEQFNPEVAVVIDSKRADDLRSKLSNPGQTEILIGESGNISAATHPDVEMVVSSIVGAAGLMPTLEAVKAGKEIALANKETLVMAGDIVMGAAQEYGVSILPVDSEHSAIFQCLEGHRREDFSGILLTASGGPFRTRPIDQFESITLKDALSHPTWNMGKKISIDSATLMNKGLEVIEAKYLFDVPCDQIEVVVHPQSIVHSMVSYRDGSVIAQMGIPDMRGAIAYAMSYPERLPLELPIPDFPKLGSLDFQAPDLDKFPCLALAYRACATGLTLPAVLNAANEVVVDGFLNEKISFLEIPDIINRVMDKHRLISNPSLSDIIESDNWARDEAKVYIEK